ncbi:MAG TPA: ABC transporter permease [Bryobacteraceae bacterium]|nr:ABC transporter permease [Bryobacteraceae bacterium]
MTGEFRQGARGLWHDRSFSMTVILSLAVGIGANTAIFSLVNGVLLRPPAYRDPGRVVAIGQSIPKFAKLYPELPVNLGILEEWRKRTRSFEGIAAARPGGANLTGAGEPEAIAGAVMSANLLTVLGVAPRLGRGFLPAEDQAGHHVVLLADSLWRRRYHADRALVGRDVTLDGEPWQVIGILPPDFVFPSASGLFSNLKHAPEVFKPLGYHADDLKLEMGDFNYWVTARLRLGVSPAAANAEINAVQATLSKEMPDNLDLHGSVKPVVEEMTVKVREGLILMMAAVGAVLLVLWVNLANLSLVRAAGRARDTAIRTALGAGRTRLARQSLAESMLLSVTGGTLGAALAWWGVRVLVAAAPIDLPRLHEVHVDSRVLLFALAVSLAAGVLLGLLPVFGSAASAPYETLKSGGRANTEARGGLRVRNLLVSLEVGLSAALLVTAGLLAASFLRVMHVDKGFDVERVLALDLSLPNVKYQKDADRAAFYQRVIEGAARLPGVEQVSMISVLPLQGETWIDIVGRENDPRPLLEKPSTNVRFVSPGYFRTLHIAIARGRDIEERDRGRRVTVISAGLARKVWPDQDALGRKLDNGNNQPLEVIGITPDIRSANLDKDPVNIMYIPYWQRPQPVGSLLVRTAMEPTGMAAALRRLVWDADAEVPIREMRTLEQVMAESVAGRRFQVLLIGLFAAAALSLAAIGTYGVVAYAVGRRRAEMGIRMALGANREDVLRLVLLQGMAPVAVGLAAGALGALALGKYVASMLFDVSPRDPLAFAAAAAVLLAVSVAACLLPARRAMQVNPIEALRFE